MKENHTMVCDGLKEMIRHGVTAYHVVAYAKDRLLQAGFEELPYGEPWKVRQNGRYMISPFPSMLVAVKIGCINENSMVRIATAHTDSPCLKVKFHSELPGKHYAQINVEPYGGLLPKTWFDRPLALAGKLVLQGEDVFHPVTRLVDSKRAICIIPSLAPHLSKGTDAKELNIQKEMMPIVGLFSNNEEYKTGVSANEEVVHAKSVNEDNNPSGGNHSCMIQNENGETHGFLMDYLCEEFGITADKLLDYDLYLYNPEQPESVGIHSELVCAPRIDNLASVAALLEALVGEEGGDDLVTGRTGDTDSTQITERQNPNIQIAAMFDNEEIGSRSKQGADSTMLPQIIDKLGRSLLHDIDWWKDLVAKGFLLSMDGAQGCHPNYGETSDPTNPVYLGQGIVLKTSASQRYLSDAEAGAIIKGLCEEQSIPWQQQVNRSGMPGGQTLGPILAAVLPLQGADIGIPMLAMHSARELAAWKDYQALVELAKIYYRYEC